MKCGKCGKIFSHFYIPKEEFQCPRCKSTVICDSRSYWKLFNLHFLILFGLSLINIGILTLFILAIIISIPFFYRYINMECRVIKEGDADEEDKNGDINAINKL